jgi:hypothetical protein
MYPAITPNCPITYERLKIESEAAVPIIESSSVSVAFNSDFVLDNCDVNFDKKLTANTIVARGTQIKLVRSLVFGSDGGGYIPMYVKATANAPIIVGSYVVGYGTSKPIVSERTAWPCVILENSIVQNVFGTTAIECQTAKPKIKNSVILGSGSTHLILHSAPLVYTNDDIDYSVLKYGSQNVIGNFNLHGTDWVDGMYKLTTVGDFSALKPIGFGGSVEYGDGVNRFGDPLGDKVGML